MAIEVECKIPVPDRGPPANKLAALGATHHGDAAERNRVFDTDPPTLFPAGMLLRLRTHDGEPGGLLTLKRPLADGAFAQGKVDSNDFRRQSRCAPGESPSETTSPPAFKRREEIETRVDNPDAFVSLLAALGYRVTRRYEKRRDAWTWRGCAVALDDCPGLGAFVEVEGAEDAIRAVLADLGLDPGAHVPENYITLWDRHRAASGLPPGDMLL